MKLIGKVNRNTKYLPKSIYNETLHNYFKTEGLALPTGYKYAEANVAAEIPSISKYDRHQPVLDEPAFREAGEWMRRHFLIHMMGAQVRDVTTALQGMDMTTSPGYPWSIGAANKKIFLERDGVKIIKHFAESLGSKPAWTPLWTSSVKGEMRPDEKVAQNKLRTFTASPIELSTATNMLCADMNEKFYTAGKKGAVWSAVGTSKYNRGWNSMGQRIARHPNTYELDESAYDASIFRRIFEKIRDFRIECLGGKHATEMHWIYYFIVNAWIVLTNGLVVEKDTGNPSGSANTVVDNTMALFLLLAYSYIILCKRYGKKYDYGEFLSTVEALLYGDDNTFSTSNELVSWYNAKLVSEIFSSVGVKTTAGDDIWEPRKLTEVKFLSHGFKLYNGTYYVPVPEYSKIMCSLLCGSKQRDPRWHLMRALALYVESFWNEECRCHIKGYINYLVREYRTSMFQGVIAKGVTMAQVENMMVSDDVIRRLYLTMEEVSSEDFQVLSTIQRIRAVCDVDQNGDLNEESAEEISSL